MFKMDHFNFNVIDMEKSIEFYKTHFHLEIANQNEAPDGNYKLVFLKNSDSDFRLELTWLADHPQPYDLGEVEFHLAFVEDYDQTYSAHKKAGIICFENPGMGIYFVEDPDGYWIEVLPKQ